MMSSKTTIFVVVATILAVSGLGYAFMASENNRKDYQNLTAEIQDLNSDLTSMQNTATTLDNSLTELSQNVGNLDQELQTDIQETRANVSDILTQISAIQDDLSSVQADITDIQSDITALSTQITNIQTSVQDLQSRVALLEGKVSTLESERPIVIRLNFLSFVPDNTPPGGEDYLFDADVTGPEIYAHARTGHSRFIKPKYLDLAIRNGTRFIGTQATIRIYAYWHLDDVVIDIDPVDGPTIGTNPTGGYLTLTYTIGTVLQGEVDGNDDGYDLIDLYDAYLEYKIETLF